MTLAVEERVDRLEALLGEFIVATKSALIRMERGMAELREDTRIFKREMLTFKDEMRVFKDEMGEFKDHVHVLMGGMTDFKREMKDFKDEMRDFKDETRAFREEMKEDRREMNRNWGDLANKMGTLVEDIAAPNIPGIARTFFQIEEFDFFAVRVKKTKRDRSSRREFDIIAFSPEAFLVVDVKSRPQPSDVPAFLSVLEELGAYFPEAADRRVIPVYGALYIPEDMVTYLTRSGIYALGMKDDTMGLLNFDELQTAQGRT